MRGMSADKRKPASAMGKLGKTTWRASCYILEMPEVRVLSHIGGAPQINCLMRLLQQNWSPLYAPTAGKAAKEAGLKQIYCTWGCYFDR